MIISSCIHVVANDIICHDIHGSRIYNSETVGSKLNSQQLKKYIDISYIMLSMDKEQCFKAKVATWGLKWKKKKGSEI